MGGDKGVKFRMFLIDLCFGFEVGCGKGESDTFGHGMINRMSMKYVEVWR